MKKVLILCTGNSCRSIIGEAIVNRYLGFKGIKAFSAGSDPVGRVNPNAKKVLEEERIWEEGLHSKKIDEITEYGPFDLVVTVCDNAKETCPIFTGRTKTVHVGFEDPHGRPYEAFVDLVKEMKKKLLPEIEKGLEV